MSQVISQRFGSVLVAGWEERWAEPYRVAHQTRYRTRSRWRYVARCDDCNFRLDSLDVPSIRRAAKNHRC